MSALTQHTMRTPTLQPVPESLPVADSRDHCTVPSVSKSVKSKVGRELGGVSCHEPGHWTLLIIILSTPASENQFDLSYIWYRPLIITQSRNWVLGKSPNFNRCQLITAIIPSHYKEACDDILNCPLITNHLEPRVTELVEMMRWLDYLLYTSPRHCRQLSLLIKSGW